MKKIFILVLIIIVQQTHSQEKTVYQNIETIVNETQKVISIDKGEKIDTTYFKTLFLPTAHFTVVGKENGKYRSETMGLYEFVETLTDDYYSNGYFEKGTGSITEKFNGIAHVIQSFYGEDSEGEKNHGVGSYQLVFANGRWWIANMIWTMSSDNGKDIPSKYLKK